MQALSLWFSTWTLEPSPRNFMLSLMIGSLQLLPVLMTSQTSILLHGPNSLEIVSSNSSGKKMTPRLTQKTSLPLKPSPPGKVEFLRLWTPPCLLYPCQYLLLNLQFHSLLPSLPCAIFPMSPRFPPIAVPSPSVGASPPVQHQSNKPHLAQPQQQREPSSLEDTHSPQPPQKREPS